MTSNEPTDADIVAALEGRPTRAQERDHQSITDALTGRDRAAEAHSARVTAALTGQPDPFTAARDARTVEALTGHAPAGVDPLWMERAEVNLAADAYARAVMERHSHSETLASATERAERARDKYMAEQRDEHATEAQLLEATSAHLTALAASYRSPAARTAESSVWSRAFRERTGTTTPAASTTTRMTRLN